MKNATQKNATLSIRVRKVKLTMKPPQTAPQGSLLLFLLLLFINLFKVNKKLQALIILQ